MDQFHLSIPAVDLDATQRWYVEGLGCVAGRRSAHALILDLGGHQLVAQRTDPAVLGEQQRGIYPRHFGLVFTELASWQALLERSRAAGLRHFGSWLIPRRALFDSTSSSPRAALPRGAEPTR